MRRSTRTSPRSRQGSVIVAVAAVLALIAACTLWAYAVRGRGDTDAGSRAPAAQQQRPSALASKPVGRIASPPGDNAVADDLARLRSIKLASPSTKLVESPLPHEYREQPDLFARAFVTQLLTQDYATPREAHLAWVQSESARTDEPLVTGMIPAELRDRLALFSVTDQRNGPSAVPSPEQWERLARQRARATAVVQAVTEPLAWSNAVEAGRVSDPGVTARQVTATVTLHRTLDGLPSSSQTSIALTLNLVGPPTRGQWAFVTLITYRAVPMGPS